jgi:hypothetical protein
MADGDTTAEKPTEKHEFGAEVGQPLDRQVGLARVGGAEHGLHPG